MLLYHHLIPLPLSLRKQNTVLYKIIEKEGGVRHYLTTHTSLSRIRCGFAPSFVNYKKGALDSQPQVIKFTSCLPMVGALGTPASSTTKTGHHDIAEILLKVALKHQNSKINQPLWSRIYYWI